MSFALDVNILVFASDTKSDLHARAKSFLESCVRGETIFYLAWPTVMGYLRIVTHPSILGRPLLPEEALSNIEELLSLPHVRILSEEREFWRHFRETAKGLPLRGNVVPDAHIAAILRQHGVKTFYTHDQDFRRFRFLEVRDPLA